MPPVFYDRCEQPMFQPIGSIYFGQRKTDFFILKNYLNFFFQKLHADEKCIAHSFT